MLPIPVVAAQNLVRAGVHWMASVDATSALALTANEAVVNYALDHDMPWMAALSMHTISAFDGIGSSIIALVLAILATLTGP